MQIMYNVNFCEHYLFIIMMQNVTVSNKIWRNKL